MTSIYESLRDVLNEHDPASAPLPTVGEYLYAHIRSELRGENEPFDALVRAVQNEVIADTLGLVPTVITGDLIKMVDATRYVVNSMRPMPLPDAGKTFSRPLAVTRTLAGVQANEFDVLQSRAMEIDPIALTKHTHGTVLSISEQDIDWTSPELLQIAVEDMADSYGISTEAEAAAAVEAGIVHGTNDGTLALTADAPTFHQAVATGAGVLYNACKRLPDVLYVAVDRWAYMAGLVDTAGRPIYPNLGPVNAPGTLDVTSFDGAPMGLKLVVSPAFRAGFVALGASRFLESYETNKGLLSVPAPATLSVTVAYRGYYTTNIQAKGLQALSELGADGFWGPDLT